MISKRILKTHKCETLQDFFQIVIETQESGQRKEVLSYIEEMGYRHQLVFLRWLICEMVDELANNKGGGTPRYYTLWKLSETVLTEMEAADPYRNNKRREADKQEIRIKRQQSAEV